MDLVSLPALANPNCSPEYTFRSSELRVEPWRLATAATVSISAAEKIAAVTGLGSSGFVPTGRKVRLMPSPEPRCQRRL
ncbi:hypothetical protein, partial [Mycobacterium avium]|uniref:hypothetical protein n=1 Tax=Mycobacterium avium TaxID=1764 RepID=UPI001F3682EF